jgi:acylglycerol lipase
MPVTLFKTSDQEELTVHSYQSKNEKTIAVFIAGIESHGGWYETSLNYLKTQGVTSFFLDRRGSGQSKGKRGDLISYERLIQDILEFAASLKNKNPEKPVNLNAVSWGAKIALALWFKGKENPFNKIILVTPGIYRKVDMPFIRKLSVAASSVLMPDTMFPIPIPINYFTNDQNRLKYLENDPFRLKKVSTRFLMQNRKLDECLNKHEGQYPQPLYLFSAGGDKIVDNKKNIPFLKRHFFDIKVKEYSNVYHTLEFDETIAYKEDLARANLE